MKREITCIVCPRGCRMTADIQAERITVTGHSCTRGEKHAVAEILHPVRSLTSIVRVSNRRDTMVSVKTAQPVAKGKMQEVMAALRSTQVNAPLSIGDVILQDICGSNIIATKSIQ